ncbi:hypothetical protein [Nocardioides euryhalodurans]|uniref:hypothetical protein n=1 Tax=Nocardioides euryhalodurans TaxID=2518370 RepID=UPI001423451D|nr:hypothetical protein [Nocardioides euryhalodurans]
MRRLLLPVALAAALLAGCSGDDPAPTPAPEPTASDSPTSTPDEPSPSPTDEPPSSPTREPGAGALDWQPVAGPVEDLVTVSGPWTLTQGEDGSSAELSGPDPRTVGAPAGFRITDTLIDGEYAVVVAGHEQETKPGIATVVELATGDVTRIDGSSDPATTNGGSWALGSGLLTHATVRKGDYCLAVVDLVAGSSRLGPCAPPRSGFNNVTTTAAGTSAMTFDSGRPSCRTLNRVEGASFVPLAGVTDCVGWDSAVTEVAQVWSEIPDERRIEVAEFFTDDGNGTVELGPGTSGTLTWCGDAAYFVRDPQRDSDPARLVRVLDGEAEVVYESPGTGRAFLSAPRCGGTDLTLTAFSAAGDEQVTTSLR